MRNTFNNQLINAMNERKLSRKNQMKEIINNWMLDRLDSKKGKSIQCTKEMNDERWKNAFCDKKSVWKRRKSMDGDKKAGECIFLWVEEILSVLPANRWSNVFVCLFSIQLMLEIYTNNKSHRKKKFRKIIC